MFRQHLLFSWTFSFGFIRYFRFEVSLFGLSCALYSFTKLLKLLVKKWKTEGKSIVVYLDYSLGSAANYIEAKITSLAVHVDLLKFGLLPNEEKSIWDLAQDIIWLELSLTPQNASSLRRKVEFINLWQRIYCFFWGRRTPFFRFGSSPVCVVKFFRRLGTASGT